MKLDIKKLLISLGIPLAVGGLSALVSGGFGERYQNLKQPPFAPPGWLFPIVWSILYLLMGYAAYRVWVSPAEKTKKIPAWGFYIAQLLLNFLWSPIFFRLEMRLTAFFIMLALWVAIALTLRFFSQIDEFAGDLLLPYLLWVTFAAYLNLGVFFLN